MPISDELAFWSFSFFPCHSGTGTDQDKRPLLPSWKAYQERRPTPAEVELWEQRYAGCNWAIVTGSISGVVVLDVDSEEGERAIERLGGVPETVMAYTGKGRHIYFRHPGFRVKNRVKDKGFIEGCDFRGDGGYVMAPGSRHPEGRLYQWIHTPEDVEFADMPDWLMFYMRAEPEPATPPAPPLPVERSSLAVERYAQKALESELSDLSKVSEGGRNFALNVSALKMGGLIGAGMINRGAVESHLLSVALQIGLPEREARATIRSGIEAGMKTPRQLPPPRARTEGELYRNGSTSEPPPEEPEPAPVEEPPQRVSKAWRPTPTNRPERAPPVLTIGTGGGSVRIGSEGNLSLIISPPGSGKSSLCMAVMAAAMNPSCDSLGLHVQTVRGVCYLDTERDRADFWDGYDQMKRRAGLGALDELPAAVDCALVTELPTREEKLSELEMMIDARPGLLIVDGLADFVPSVNDEEACNDFLAWLRAKAGEHRIAVLATIHDNPTLGNEKARGHLGSEAQRRAESVLYLKRDDVTGIRTLTTKFSHGKNRSDSDQVETSFIWSRDERMHVACEGPSQGKPSREADLRQMTARVFGAATSMPYSKLLQAIQEETGKGFDNSKYHFKNMKSAGLIEQHPVDKTWLLTPPEADDAPF